MIAFRGMRSSWSQMPSVRGVGCLTLATLLSSAAHAQSEPQATPSAVSAQIDPVAEAPAPERLGEITVTARKRSENITETPLAISAYDTKSLAARGIDSVHALDGAVPSVTITNFGAGNISENTVFIRGIGTADHILLTDPGVGIYLDGVYLGRSMGSNMSLANIDQVEVLRGPQGTLSGRNTIGGAVNITTREPDQNEHAEITGTVGSRGRANASFYGDTPLTDTLSISLTGTYEHRNGIGDYVNLPGVKRRVGEIDQGSGRFEAKWAPSDRFSLLFAMDGMSGHYGVAPLEVVILNHTGQFTTPTTDGTPYLSQSSLPGKADDYGTGDYRLAEDTAKGYGFSLTPKYRIDDHLSAKIIASERYNAYTAGLDDTDSVAAFSNFPEQGYARQYTGEAQLNGEYGRFNFVTGLYAFHETGFTTSEYTYDLVPGGEFDEGQKTTSYAAYVHAGVDLTDNLKLSGGVRYTHDHKRAFVFIKNDIDPGIFRARSWSAPTYDASLDYKVAPRLNAYATIQHGYESGGYPPRP